MAGTTRYGTPQVTEVGSTSTLLAIADAARKSVTITNIHVNPLFLGSFAAVTVLTGLNLSPGASVTLNTSAAIYGIATANARASVVEVVAL